MTPGRWSPFGSGVVIGLIAGLAVAVVVGIFTGAFDDSSDDPVVQARDVIDPGVLPGEDAAQAGLGGHVGVAAEGPYDPGHRGRADGDRVTVAEDRREDRRTGRADRAVGTGIRRVGGRGREWRPGRVADR